VQPVVRPFLVGAKIGDRGFYFNNNDFAVAAERDEIGAASRRQRQLADHRVAERVQEARRTARDSDRSRRLPSIDRHCCRLRRKAHGQDSGQRQV